MKAIPWATVGLLVLFLRSPGDQSEFELPHLVISFLVIGFGITVFWSHGRHQVTAAGVFSLAMAVFVGFSGVWVNLVGFGDIVVSSASVGISEGQFFAAVVCYFGHLAMYGLFWSRPPEYYPVRIESAALSRWGVLLGALALVCGRFLDLTVGTGATPLSLLGCAIIFSSLILHSHSIGSLGLRLVSVGVLTVIVAVTIFSAYGRLMLVSLGLTAVVTASAMGYKQLKIWVLLGLPPVLSILVAFREAAQRDLGVEENGLGSVLSPVVTFGRLIDGGLSGVGGNSYLASVLWWVPRSMWPDKPDGLGAQIASWLEPEAALRGHSMASSGFGEWYFNIGWLGVLLFVLVFGFAVKELDGLLSIRTQRNIDDRSSLIIWIAVVVLVAELPAFAWSGTFTYSTRAGMKLIFLLFVWIMTVWFMGERAKQNRDREVVK